MAVRVLGVFHNCSFLVRVWFFCFPHLFSDKIIAWAGGEPLTIMAHILESAHSKSWRLSGASHPPPEVMIELLEVKSMLWKRCAKVLFFSLNICKISLAKWYHSKSTIFKREKPLLEEESTRKVQLNIRKLQEKRGTASRLSLLKIP